MTGRPIQLFNVASAITRSLAEIYTGVEKDTDLVRAIEEHIGVRKRVLNWMKALRDDGLGLFPWLRHIQCGSRSPERKTNIISIEGTCRKMHEAHLSPTPTAALQTVTPIDPAIKQVFDLSRTLPRLLTPL